LIDAKHTVIAAVNIRAAALFEIWVRCFGRR
jgi:hypothetical protein